MAYSKRQERNIGADLGFSNESFQIPEVMVCDNATTVTLR